MGSIPHMPDVVMPRLSDSMEEGTILKWLKAEGDEIARGDELVEIETDKATMTYEADTAGALAIVAQEGETLPIGQVIARIGGGGEAPASEDGVPGTSASERAAFAVRVTGLTFAKAWSQSGMVETGTNTELAKTRGKTTTKPAD